MLAAFAEIGRLEAGCDEAGRGCLAGPVFAAAVILPPDFSHPLLNDSKKLQENTRQLLRPIIEKEAISWAVAYKDVDTINQLNILWASVAAVHAALDQLDVRPDFILMDGNRFLQYPNIPHATIIKGDGKFASIAAASVLAKTHRDAHMEELDALFPEYNWRQNKGYPTTDHREALSKYGITPHHRTSFRLFKTETPEGKNTQNMLF